MASHSCLLSNKVIERIEKITGLDSCWTLIGNQKI